MDTKADRLRMARLAFSLGLASPGTRWLYLAAAYGILMSANLLYSFLRGGLGSDLLLWWITVGFSINLGIYVLLALVTFHKRHDSSNRDWLIWFFGATFLAAFAAFPVFGLIAYVPAFFLISIVAPR